MRMNRISSSILFSVTHSTCTGCEKNLAVNVDLFLFFISSESCHRPWLQDQLFHAHGLTVELHIIFCRQLNSCTRWVQKTNQFPPPPDVLSHFSNEESLLLGHHYFWTFNHAVRSQKYRQRLHVLSGCCTLVNHVNNNDNVGLDRL